MFLHTWHPHPLIATIGGLQLHWYGLLLAVAAVVSISLIGLIGKRYQLDPNRLFDVALLVLIFGFIGARLYHVLNEWQYYQAYPVEIFKVWKGGLALHGGLIAGAATLIIVAKRWKWNVWLVADIFAPAFAVAQAIGRWGNYFNQELFGQPTSLPWGIPIDAVNRPTNLITHDYFHPTFLYESLGLLIIAGVLWWMHSHRWKQPSKTSITQYGAIALIYIILASALRIATESLRVDRTPIIGGIRLPILVAGGLFLLSLFVLLARYRQPHVHTSAA